MKIQLSVDDVTEALTRYVADTFGQSAGDVSVVRVIRKQGGGVEADVIVTPTPQVES